jgi:hypothetical protein
MTSSANILTFEPMGLRNFLRVDSSRVGEVALVLKLFPREKISPNMARSVAALSLGRGEDS